MSKTILILVGLACAVISAAGIMRYNDLTLTALAVEESGLYPKSLVDSAWERPQGLPFDKEKITPLVISAFFHNAKPPGNITPTVQAYVEIPCKFTDINVTVTFAIAVVSLISKDERIYSDYLVLFSANKPLTKLSEESLVSGGYRTYAALSLQPCRGEDNPFIYLFSESGANSSDFSHNLYRIERKERRLRKIWEYSEDYYNRSGDCAYKVSNINLCGFDGKGEKRIVIYTTSGIRRYDFGDREVEDLAPNYNKTIYIWDSVKQSFMKK